MIISMIILVRWSSVEGFRVQSCQAAGVVQRIPFLVFLDCLIQAPTASAMWTSDGRQVGEGNKAREEETIPQGRQ